MDEEYIRNMSKFSLLTIAGLIMHVYPQRSVSKAPFLTDDTRSFPSDILQQPNMTFAQVAHAADRTVLHDGYEIEGRNRLQIPFHVRQYYERR